LDDEIPWDEFDLPALVRKHQPHTVIVGRSHHAPLAERLFHKEGIGAFYRFFQKNPLTTLESVKIGTQTPEWAMGPLCRILEELALIQAEGETLRLIESPDKKNLSDSPTYLRLVEAKTQWAFLADESLERIKTYFTTLMEAPQS